MATTNASTILRALDQMLQGATSSYTELIVGLPVPTEVDPSNSRALIRSLHELGEYIADPIKYAAAKARVSVNDYRRWLASDGWAYCSSPTRSGSRCRNHVSGGMPLTVEEWLRLEGQYCAVHGGEPGVGR